MMQRAATVSPVPVSSGSGDAEDDDIERLLSQTSILQGVRALVVATHGLNLFSALIRRGCLSATCLRPTARPEAACHDLALFPTISVADAPEHIVASARRTLLPGGRFVGAVSGDPAGRLARGLARRLKLNGFVNVRTRITPLRTLVRADLPAAETTRIQLGRTA